MNFKIDDVTAELVRLALLEDVRGGDVTTLATIDAQSSGSAILLAKSALVMCGHDVAREVCRQHSV